MDASFVNASTVSSYPHMTAHDKTGGCAQLRKKSVQLFLGNKTKPSGLINSVIHSSHLLLIKGAAILDYELQLSSLKFRGAFLMTKLAENS